MDTWMDNFFNPGGFSNQHMDFFYSFFNFNTNSILHSVKRINKLKHKLRARTIELFFSIFIQFGAKMVSEKKHIPHVPIFFQP